MDDRIAGRARCRPAPVLRHAEVEGCRVILDLERESYRVLDDVAGAMWNALTARAGREPFLAALAERYDVEPARLEADLDAFERRCLADGLLERAEPGARAAPPPPAPPPAPARFAAPTTLAAWRTLFATRRALARTGFRATYERCAALPAGARSDRLSAAAAAFVRAENLFVVRRAPDDCLVRSLALYRFLRACGIPAEHVIGVRRFPFQAHAWVECGGEAVIDERQRRQRFTPLARIGEGTGSAGQNAARLAAPHPRER